MKGNEHLWGSAHAAHLRNLKLADVNFTLQISPMPLQLKYFFLNGLELDSDLSELTVKLKTGMYVRHCSS